MAYVPIAQPPVENYDTDDRVTAFIKKYKEAEQIHDHWKDKYEEAYEYTMPQRESFYEETICLLYTSDAADE